MSDINRVVLTGRLTRDAELRYTAAGDPVLSFRLAFSTWGKAGDGSWGELPNFVDVVVFGNRAQSVAPYALKGRRIALDGRLRWREWQPKEGGKRQVVEIAADEVQLLEWGGDGPHTHASASTGRSFTWEG